jgi:spermidine/putrescine transport system permease protein
VTGQTVTEAPHAPRVSFRAALAMTPTWAVVVGLFLIPTLFLVAASFATFDYNSGRLVWSFTLENYASLLRSSTFVAFGNSLLLSVTAAVACILLAYPIAYAISLTRGFLQNLLLLAVIMPFWTAFVVRVYSWLTLLGPGDLVTGILTATGLFPAGLDLNYTPLAVFLGLVYCYLPLAVLPIYAILEQRDRGLVSAAQDLGMSATKAFFQITLPMSLPGVGVAALLVGVPSLGEYTIPAVLGGGKTLMVGNLITNAFSVTGNYAAGSAIAVLLLVAIVIAYLVPAGVRSIRRTALRLARGSRG